MQKGSLVTLNPCLVLNTTKLLTLHKLQWKEFPFTPCLHTPHKKKPTECLQTFVSPMYFTPSTAPTS